MVKNPPADAGDIRDVGLIPGLGRSHGNPLQYSCLENPMDRSLKGYSPCSRKESDMTEHTRMHTHTSSAQSHMLGNVSVSAKSRPLVTLGIRRLLWEKSSSPTSLLVEESKIPACPFLLGKKFIRFCFFQTFWPTQY